MMMREIYSIGLMMRRCRMMTIIERKEAGESDAQDHEVEQLQEECLYFV